MREIKFRCWTESAKKMYYPEQLQGFGICPMTGLLMEVIDHGTDGASLEKTQTKDILMQYTGLKDKNGVEIYEGDILKFNTKGGNEMVYEVKWKGKGFKPTRMSDDNQEEIEIIGNIYQNPELLQDTNK